MTIAFFITSILINDLVFFSNLSISNFSIPMEIITIPLIYLCIDKFYQQYGMKAIRLLFIILISIKFSIAFFMYIVIILPIHPNSPLSQEKLEYIFHDIPIKILVSGISLGLGGYLKILYLHRRARISKSTNDSNIVFQTICNISFPILTILIDKIFMAIISR